MHYFESYKGVDPIPPGTNPASWMLEVSLPCTPDTHPGQLYTAAESLTFYIDVEPAMRR